MEEPKQEKERKGLCYDVDEEDMLDYGEDDLEIHWMGGVPFVPSSFEIEAEVQIQVQVELEEGEIHSDGGFERDSSAEREPAPALSNGPESGDDDELPLSGMESRSTTRTHFMDVDQENGLLLRAMGTLVSKLFCVASGSNRALGADARFFADRQEVAVSL